MTEWAVQLDGAKPFPVGDLSPADVQRIADKHGVSWLQVMQSPGIKPDVLYEVLEVVAVRLGVTPPAAPEKASDSVKLLGLLIVVEDDLPGSWTDGNPTEGEPATT